MVFLRNLTKITHDRNRHYRHNQRTGWRTQAHRHEHGRQRDGLTQILGLTDWNSLDSVKLNDVVSCSQINGGTVLSGVWVVKA